MFKHGLDLLASYAREPIKKLIDPRPALEILEKRLHGYARTLEQPDAAHLARHALNSGTFAPIEHDWKIRPRTDASKPWLWLLGSRARQGAMVDASGKLISWVGDLAGPPRRSSKSPR